jgi:hypothetical protein
MRFVEGLILYNNVIKEFQTELLSILFDCEDVKGIRNKGYENALVSYQGFR